MVSYRHWRFAIFDALTIADKVLEASGEGIAAFIMEGVVATNEGLTAEEVHDFIMEGLVATNEGWLACSVHTNKGRGKMFATWFWLGLDLDLDIYLHLEFDFNLDFR